MGKDVFQVTTWSYAPDSNGQLTGHQVSREFLRKKDGFRVIDLGLMPAYPLSEINIPATIVIELISDQRFRYTASDGLEAFCFEEPVTDGSQLSGEGNDYWFWLNPSGLMGFSIYQVPEIYQPTKLSNRD